MKRNHANNLLPLNHQPKINWFPGHMHKSFNYLKKLKKDVDLVIEILDARAINASSNAEITTLFQNKPILKLYLKQDLADCGKLTGLTLINSAEVSTKATIIRLIETILAPKLKRLKSQGQIKPIIQVVVCGLTNMGKSTIINKLVGKKVAKSADLPGWTKGFSRFKFFQNMWVYDTPGVFHKRVEDLRTGYVLALIGAIKREVIPLQPTLEFAFGYLQKHYLSLLQRMVENLTTTTTFLTFIHQLAIKRHFVIHNQEIDYLKTM